MRRGLGAEEKKVLLLLAVALCRSLNQLTLDRRAQLRVEHNAEQRAPAWKTRAIGQSRIVSENGADPCEQSVGGMSQPMHLLARLGPGQPVCGSALARRRGWGKVPIDRDRRFEGDQRSAVLDETGEREVQVAGCGFTDPKCDGEAGGAHPGQTPAAYQRVRIRGGDDTASDSGGDQGIGTGAGATVVRTGFKRDEGGSTTGIAAVCHGLFERDDFGVILFFLDMWTF